MKRFLASVVAGSMFVCALAAPTDALTKQLNANYTAMVTAFKNKDILTFSKYYSPNYKATAPDGTVITRFKLMGDIQGEMNSLKDVDWTRKVIKLAVKGDVAVATVAGDLKATTPIMKDKKTHRVEIITTTENTWKKSGKNWVIISAKTTKRTMRQDGKPLKNQLGMGRPAKPGT